MTLFEFAAARTARECSAQARASISLGHTQGLVLIALREAGHTGLTALELEAACELKGSTVRPRLLELEERGLVVRTADKRKSMGARTPSQVWRAR